MSKKKLSRRNFMKTATASAAAAGAASSVFGAAHPRVVGSNERIRVGIIGPGGRAAEPRPLASAPVPGEHAARRSKGQQAPARAEDRS